MDIGSQCKFDYPDYGTPDGYPGHTAHSGQLVTILAEVETDAEVERLFSVKAQDGWTGEVFESELTDAT